jgi:hypothetical protein
VLDALLPRRLRSCHIECGVSISGPYSKLTELEHPVVLAHTGVPITAVMSRARI